MNGAVFPTVEMARPVQPPNGTPGVSSAIRLVAQNLAICAQNKSCDVDSFSQHCITLSRGMDYAISNKFVPAQVSELPVIFKLVCQRRNEFSLQAAIMVLMVTVKNACKAQWFSSQESQELLALTDEVVSMFCTPEGFSCEQANIIPTVSQIMSRYYPQLKLGCILASVAIKPGFEACAVDFHISKTVNRSATERIHLLVAIKDNIDTSSCIINPPKVNILLNGVGIQGRIVGCMYQGPQLPTLVNPMLRYGTNLLQAIGHFDAHCIVLIAYMSTTRPCDLPAPHDYHQPPAALVDSEAEIIEGPSKISLNCPISFTRIRKPVKGHLCKHFQCFDLSNYIGINFKRPSWRCPHCNQPVCYPDIRIDQKMVKILQEVAENVTNVIIHSDGSWEAFSGSSNNNGESHADVFQELQPDQQEASGMLTPSNIYDLTEGNDDIICLDFDAPEDSKVLAQPEANGLALLGNSHGQADYTRMSNPEANGVVPPAPSFSHSATSPALTYSVPPAVNREQQAFLGTNQQSSSPTSVHPPLNNNLWLQQQHHGQMMSSGHGAYAVPGNVSRTPVAAQAFPPVQVPSSSPMMPSRAPFMNGVPRNNSSLPLNTSLPHPVTFSTSTSTSRMGSIQQQYIIQSQLQQISNAQMRGTSAPAQVTTSATRATPPGHEARHQQIPMYQMLPQTVCTTSNLRATSQMVNQTVYPHNHRAASPGQPTRPSQIRQPRTLSATEIMNMNILAEHGLGSGSGAVVQRVSRTEDLLGAQQPNEQNRQPTGRMRGSLVGRAYNEARDQLMIRPTQQTRPSAPTQNNMLSPQLQVLLANRNLHASQPNLPQNN